jgi:hypothetical protein
MKRSKNAHKGFSRISWKRAAVAFIALAFIAVLALGMLLKADRSTGVKASTSPAPTPRNQKRYIATKKIVVDKQTGQLRMPTAEETDKLVDDLSELAKRPEDLPQTSASGTGVSIDLQGGYGGVMLARPNSDGTFETRCVFTFEEGAEFLGLVEEAPTE